MQRTDTMEFLIDQAQRARDAAAAQAAQATRQVADAQAQHTLLDRYRDEYRQRWTGVAQRGTSVTELATHRDFLSRLDVAITQQLGQIDHAQALARHAQEKLTQAECKLQSLLRVQDNRQAALALKERRREQRADDETAAHAARRAAGGAYV
ncbi:MAG TPA: flagellar export protein FliJ [Burkholderiaceae bacterium]|nr:flagellar export protein FliJ [Burkholderiaceae bacterium]